MKPYYEHAGVAIYHCDATEHTGYGGHAIITDPVWPNCPPDLLPGSHDPRGLFRRFCEITHWDLFRRSVFILRHDCDPRFLAPVPFQYARSVQLPYVMPGYIGRWLGGDETAYCFGIPIPRREGQIVIPGRAPAVQPDERAANGHPCSRALRHMEFLVRWWSEPDEVVFDPFCGSGTTLVAAKNLGRCGVGFEIEERYCEIAAKRLAQEVMPFPVQNASNAPSQAVLAGIGKDDLG